MTDPASLPPFIREALGGGANAAALSEEAAPVSTASGEVRTSAEDFERSLLTLEERLYSIASAEATAIEPADPDLERAWNRLQTSVSELPFRYAPFFGKLAGLFDWSESRVISELARLREPGIWKFAGLPGIAKVAVKGGRTVDSAETLFVRFKPGVHFPRHRHTGIERVLVLEGSYADDGGIVHRAGDLREWAVGTEHSFEVHAGVPCIIASVVFGRRFDAWPLRALAAILEKRG